MTKETLIKSALRALVNGEVKQGSAGYALEEDSAYEVSWKDVLKWLEQQPSECTEHPCLDKLCRYYKQPCEDCISRQAVKDKLMESWTKYMPMELDTHLSFVLEEISELPSVIPYRPSPQQTGWILGIASEFSKWLEEIAHKFHTDTETIQDLIKQFLM